MNEHSSRERAFGPGDQALVADDLKPPEPGAVGGEEAGGRRPSARRGTRARSSTTSAWRARPRSGGADDGHERRLGEERLEEAEANRFGGDFSTRTGSRRVPVRSPGGEQALGALARRRAASPRSDVPLRQSRTGPGRRTYARAGRRPAGAGPRRPGHPCSRNRSRSGCAARQRPRSVVPLRWSPPMKTRRCRAGSTIRAAIVAGDARHQATPCSDEARRPRRLGTARPTFSTHSPHAPAKKTSPYASAADQKGSDPDEERAEVGTKSALSWRTSGPD